MSQEGDRLALLSCAALCGWGDGGQTLCSAGEAPVLLSTQPSLLPWRLCTASKGIGRYAEPVEWTRGC